MRAIRRALGARRRQLASLVVRRGARRALVGIAVGLAAALAASRLMAVLLFGVSPADPLAFAAVALLLFAVAVLASLVPALRAARVPPLEAMRAD